MCRKNVTSVVKRSSLTFVARENLSNPSYALFWKLKTENFEWFADWTFECVPSIFPSHSLETIHFYVLNHTKCQTIYQDVFFCWLYVLFLIICTSSRTQNFKGFLRRCVFVDSTNVFLCLFVRNNLKYSKFVWQIFKKMFYYYIFFVANFSGVIYY